MTKLIIIIIAWDWVDSIVHSGQKEKVSEKRPKTQEVSSKILIWIT